MTSDDIKQPFAIVWIARDKFGTRLTHQKLVWTGYYFIRQEGREFPIEGNLHNLEMGECKEVSQIVTKETVKND